MTAHDWRMDRKGINTVFTMSILKKFQPIFNRHFANFAENLEKYVDQPEFDFSDLIFECNFELVLSKCDELTEHRTHRNQLKNHFGHYSQKQCVAMTFDRMMKMRQNWLHALPGERLVPN